LSQKTPLRPEPFEDLFRKENLKIARFAIGCFVLLLMALLFGTEAIIISARRHIPGSLAIIPSALTPLIVAPLMPLIFRKPDQAIYEQFEATGKLPNAVITTRSWVLLAFGLVILISSFTAFMLHQFRSM